MTTCTLCTYDIEDGQDTRPIGEGFAHVDCAETRIFVYGTLRRGGHLEGWLPERLFREHATLAGFALHYAPHFGFPYLVRTGDPADVVTGDLVTVPVDDDEAVDAAISTAEMETHAGYEVAAVTVQTKAGDRLADAFVWPGQPGPRIESGDWFQTPEGAPWSPVPPQPAEPLTGAQDGPAVDRGTAWLRTITGREFRVELTDDDGRELWTGHSFAACSAWAKVNGYRIERVAEAS